MTIKDNLHHEPDTEVSWSFRASTVLSFLMGFCLMCLGGLAYWQYDTQKLATEHRSQDTRIQSLQDERIKALEAQVGPICVTVKENNELLIKVYNRQNQVLQRMGLRAVD